MELILKYHRSKLHHLKVTTLMLGAINIALAAVSIRGLFDILFLAVVCIAFLATAILFVASLLDAIKDTLGVKQFDATLNKVLGIAIMVTAVGKLLFDSHWYEAGAYYVSIFSSLLFYGPLHLLIGWELKEGKWDPERTRPINIMLEFKLKCSEDAINNPAASPLNNTSIEDNNGYHAEPPPRYESGGCVIVDLHKGQTNLENTSSQI